MMRMKTTTTSQRSGPVTLPSDPSLRSQRPPTALSTSKNNSEPRSRAEDEDEDNLLKKGGTDLYWKTRALTK